MAARQTSITTTAPPAPALAANVETEPAVFTSDVVLPTRVEQHPSVIFVARATGCFKISPCVFWVTGAKKFHN